jgi:hypothetical protein
LKGAGVKPFSILFCKASLTGKAGERSALRGASRASVEEARRVSSCATFEGNWELKIENLSLVIFGAMRAPARMQMWGSWVQEYGKWLD